MNKLIRGLGLTQAVAINIIDMVGIGPFVAIPFIMGAMQGPACIMAWVLGAALAFTDGAVWAELGARWPEAGGSYVFLQNLYGEKKPLGRLMSFLFTWQTIIQAPLVIASGAIGFAQYLGFLIPVNDLQQKFVSGGLVILVTLLLYRKITAVGKISLLMGLVVLGTIGWVIISGFLHFQTGASFIAGGEPVSFSGSVFSGLGKAGTKAIYCYLGYYNVCHLGAEIKNPKQNIPRSIFISIAVVAALYLLMQVSVFHVIPWPEAKDSPFIISLFFEKVQGHLAAQIATVSILLIAISSLFAVMLGYSRIPYAAATDGNFFAVFGKVHPVKNFPHISLLVIAAIAFVFSLLFKMQQVITAIIVMRILVQFIAQSAGIIAYHQKNNTEIFPYRMWLYPAPAVAAIIIWLFIFLSAGRAYIEGALCFIAIGVVLFWIKEQLKSKAPVE